MNRAAVDEENQSEILKIFELEKTSWEMSNPSHPFINSKILERKQKGMIFYQHNDI